MESDFDKEIDLSSFAFQVINNLWLIIATSFIGAILLFSLSFVFDKQYTSYALVSVKSGNNSIQNLSSRSSLGAIAALSGFSLGAGSGDKSQYVMALIKSRTFLEHLISFDGVLENLLAVKSYDENSKKITYEPYFDPISRKWDRPKETLLLTILGKNFKTAKPTVLEAFRAYDQVVSLSQDRQSQFINITVTHKSPEFSKLLIDLIVREVNMLERKSDLQESRKALDYLYSEMKDLSLIRDAMSQLIESQLQKQMLTQIGDDYLIEFIDRAYVPEDKSSPRRSLFLISGFLVGLILALIKAISRNKRLV